MEIQNEMRGNRKTQKQDIKVKKKCFKCSEEKSIDNFLYRKDREAYRNECKQCSAESRKKYRRENKEKVRDIQYRYSYGISLKEYEEMSKKQEEKCAICNIHSKYTRHSKLVVDHDHDTGEVRSLLCDKCNQAIGLLQDNSEFCSSAAAYLKEYSK